jgi:glycerophosphoryl diester phosphodiesterase
MLVIAHRGNLECGLENSWTAFQQAVDHGCDRIELDVLFSKENHPFVIHDENLLRLAGVDKNLDTLSTREVEKIPLLNGEKIPRLEEVLDFFSPKISLNIELKSTRADHAHQVGALLCNRQDPTLTILSSFYLEPLMAIRERYPTLLRAVLWGSDTWYCATPAQIGPQIFMEQVGTSIIHPETSWVTEAFMDRAQFHGWQVFPWISKSEEEKNPHAIWQRLRTLGVDGLCTNFPLLLKKWLQSST